MSRRWVNYWALNRAVAPSLGWWREKVAFWAIFSDLNANRSGNGSTQIEIRNYYPSLFHSISTIQTRCSKDPEACQKCRLRSGLFCNLSRLVPNEGNWPGVCRLRCRSPKVDFERVGASPKWFSWLFYWLSSGTFSVMHICIKPSRKWYI